MKIPLIIGAMLVTMGASAQGTVNFANIVLSGGTRIVDAPVFEIDGTTRMSGPGFQAQLFAGPDAGHMTAIGPSTGFLTGAGAGYFIGGTRIIDSVLPGENATVQVGFWATFSGATYESAWYKGRGPHLIVATGGAGSPPSLPANLIGLQSFSLVPEPSPLLLGVLAGTSLLFVRRGKYRL